MIYDIAIIGGGPAGSAAVVYSARKRLKTLCVTKDWLGQSYVSEGIENWIGTIKISGLDLSKNLELHAKSHTKDLVDFREGVLCQKIDKTGSTFKITDSKSNTYETRSVIITSGSSRRKLDIPGAREYDNKGIVYCASCDGPLYADQDVAVIGGGNAGFETAMQLLAYCKSVTLLSRSNFKADPGTIEKVLHHPKMKALEFVIPKEIRGDKFVTTLIYTDTRSNTDIEIPVTGIFSEIGSIPNTSFVKGVVEMDTYDHIIINPRNQRSSTDGIWAAGDVTDGLYHQNNIAVGDAVRAIEDAYLWLQKK